MMESSLNSGMCRCCGTEGLFKDVNATYHWMGEDEIYADMLRFSLDISLTPADDESNDGICEVCITQLRNAANFKKQVLSTEEKFKKMQDEKVFKPELVKVEMPLEEDGDSDNNLSEDYQSGADFDVPIKEESPGPKTRKRAAKATTSRAKKSKTDSGETSTKRTPLNENPKQSEKCTDDDTQNTLRQDLTTDKISAIRPTEELLHSDFSVIATGNELSTDILLAPNIDTKSFVADTENSTMRVITSVHVTPLSKERESFSIIKDFEVIDSFENGIENNLTNEIREREHNEFDVQDSSDRVADMKRRGRTRRQKEDSKRRRNSGQSYITEKGKEVPGREMMPLSDCRMKCNERLPEVERKRCFDEYWSLGSRDSRTNYVANLINISPNKTQKTNIKTHNRNCCCKYNLVIDNKEQPTCKECFCRTLGETRGFINIVIEKKKQYPGGNIPADLRGHSSTRNKESLDENISAIDDVPFSPKHEN